MDNNVNSLQVVEQQASQKINQSNIKSIQIDYNSLLKYTTTCDLQKNEIDSLLKMFKRIDYNKVGFLTYHDMMDLLKEFGFQINQNCKEKIFKEIEDRNTTKLDFQTLLYIARVCKDFESKIKENEEQIQYSEFIDAFVALGGEPDASGYVHKNKIIEILSIEFDLNFDIDELLEQLEVQNESLDFETFRQLFRAENKKSIKRNSSLLSLLSHRSMTQRSTSSISTVKIRMKDFERFLDKLQQEENENIGSPSPKK
ncbi:unnamed protein product [Paramecium pentaurelia]|uniref:EF-hand domain-containing protein n=1 Tax=Paramecium pentaurelia TaxID=43138 RepID=A0A8S1VXC6_9CILI|nr:unnamed protein product [Paramecium pentaurelia]